MPVVSATQAENLLRDLVADARCADPVTATADAIVMAGARRRGESRSA